MKPRAPDYQKERGERQQKRILDALAPGPMTVYELSERLYLNRATVSKHIAVLLEKTNKRIHAASFLQTQGRPQVRYAIGNMPDASIHRFHEDRLIAILEKMTLPQTAHQIAQLIQMSYPSARDYVRSLRKRRKIHVAGWTWSDRTCTAMFRVGGEKDAPKPKSKPVLALVVPQIWFAALLPGRAAEMREAA